MRELFEYSFTAATLFAAICCGGDLVSSLDEGERSDSSGSGGDAAGGSEATGDAIGGGASTEDLLANGAECAGDGECESGKCVDGVCCHSACDDSCLSCRVAGFEGECRPVLAGDVDAGCSGVCDGGGTCTTGVFDWAFVPGGDAIQQLSAVAVDSQRNVILVGAFQGKLDGDQDSQGDDDIYVIKLGVDGELIWSRTFGGAGADVAMDVDVDGADSIVISGYFAQSASFGGETLTSAGEYDGFISELDPDGNVMSSWQLSGAGMDKVSNVAAHDDGSIIFTIESDSASIDVGGQIHTNAGGYDIVVAKRSSSGAIVWSTGIGHAGDDWPFDLEVDALGNTYVVGSFLESIDLGFGVRYANGGRDAFVTKLGANGTPEWATTFGGNQSDNAFGVAIGPGNTVHVVGNVRGTIDFGTGATSGTEDAFWSSYTSAGVFISAARYGDAEGQRATSIVADDLGNIIIGGWFQGNIDFGGGPISSSTDVDAYVAKLAVDGTQLWSKGFGSSGAQRVDSIAVAPNGELIVAGDFDGDVDFGGGLHSAVTDRMFATKLGE